MTPDASVVQTIRGFSHNTEAYLMVAAGLCAWAASRPESIPVCAGDKLYLGNIEAVDDAIYRTIAALMTVTAIVSCYKESKVFISDVDSELSPIDNMLRMMGHMDSDGETDKKMSATINKLWILELHDQKNSALIPVSQLLIRSLALGCTVRTLRLRLTKTLRDYSVFKRLPTIQHRLCALEFSGACQILSHLQ
jgi:hypothetical protein